MMNTNRIRRLGSLLLALLLAAAPMTACTGSGTPEENRL